MSVVGSIAGSPVMFGLGVLGGVLLGPAAAAASVTVVDRRWPWQFGSRRWLLGEPASLRRRLLLSLSGALVLGSLAAVTGWRPAALAFLVMGLAGVMLAAVDLEHHRLPDRLIAPAALVSGVALTVDALVTDSWSSLLRGLLCAAVALAAFLVMALISPNGMGLGDVKLAALLSLHTGWLGWQLAIFAILGGFAAGAVLALALVVAGRATWRTAIPFGPALLGAAWLVVLENAALR